MAIPINNEEDIAKMRVAGKLASEVLDYITPFVEQGITTDKLDSLCHDYIVNVQEAIPAPLNYAPDGHTPYPKSVCTSVNHQICHGVPGEKKLKNGDTINIDITVIKDGYHGDTSRMFHVGEVSIQAKRLSELTYQAMWMGINQVKPGTTLGDIGHAIQTFTEKNGFSVVREFCGHGIGKKFHDEPQVLHYGRPKTGVTLKEGMIFTIEPMINAGHYTTKILKTDGWTAVTRDRSLSAQFEHSLAVTDDGFEIFTLSPKGFTKPPYN